MSWLRSGKKINKKSDEDLLNDYRIEGKAEALTILYDRYIHLVYGVCLKYLMDREKARDATMQIFEKLILLLKAHEIKSFRAWLYSTAKNHCLMELRKKENVTKIDGYLFMEFEDESHPIDDLDELRLQVLEKCIQELKDQQKQCVHLFYMQSNNYEQIAQITGFDLKKVKSYLQNGRRNLKICMEKNETKA